MQDFNPIALFAILYETLGFWLWILLVVAVLLLLGIISGVMRMRATMAPWRRPLLVMLAALVVMTAVAFMLVPGWTGAAPGSLRGVIDYLAVLALALIPGAIVAALAFTLATHRCARRNLSRG